ncbi:hypothetical protein NE237_022032 [Protea cynaroides]|uniref:APO domain-containing protein n=1 Tax=Protea cynaroides TaxID=273540 RepID=A0A9Q0H928_9MAGN|nr:hypothetical protein NE237_022032 [Protea cynaroides]
MVIFSGDLGFLQNGDLQRRSAKNQVHTWIDGSLNDILVPVEAFHLQNMFQDVIKHDQQFDFERVAVVLVLCYQAGAIVYDECLCKNSSISEAGKNDSVVAQSLSQLYKSSSVGLRIHKLTSVAKLTLEAWEMLRSGIRKLLLVYPAKVCKYCSEVHVGLSGHNARLCGVFKYEGWRGIHLWQKAKVDDLGPPRVVWLRRPQDPPVLLSHPKF